MSKLVKRLAAQFEPDLALRKEIEAVLRFEGDAFEQGKGRHDSKCVAALHILSLIASVLSDHPKLQKSYTRVLGRMEDEYMPSYPPMSPVTESFFQLYFFADFPLSKAPYETVADIAPLFSKKLRLPAYFEALARAIAKSRMGFYEQQSAAGTLIEARELITEREVCFKNPSGYLGAKGDVWFVRLFEHEGRAAALTTPYIISDTPVADLVAYFERQGVRCSSDDVEQKLSSLLKRSNPREFWFEYIMKGYHSFSPAAIYLTGVPDIPETLPHSGAYVSQEMAC